MGRKKKSLANRLARMSDEERARYLQRKADQEEELRRRREQLLSTFMKKKLHREALFARLNEAKLNELWHNVLRKEKINEMRREIDFLPLWFQYVFNLKNRTISTLLQQLEEVEEIYLLNFRTHTSNIDKMIDSHMKHLEAVRRRFDYDRKYILTDGEAEWKSYKIKLDRQLDHLKTVNYIQAKNHREHMEKESEEKLCKKLDVIVDNRLELELLQKNRDAIMSGIWKNIAYCLRVYVAKEDNKRSHYCQLKQLDIENNWEIGRNENSIKKLEKNLKEYQSYFNILKEENSGKIESLVNFIKHTTHLLIKTRNRLLFDNKKDYERLMFLTIKFNETYDYLKNIFTKGQQILNLIATCEKLEVKNDQIARYLHIIQFPDIDHEEETAEKPKTPLPLRISAKLRKKSAKTQCDIEIKHCESTFENLKELEGFWVRFNQVKIEVIEEKIQRRILRDENSNLKERAKDLLEEIKCKSATIPNRKISVTQRLVASAPSCRKL